MFNFNFNKSAKALLLMAMCAGTNVAKAQNPYLPLWEFIPDGEPYVFDDPDVPGKKLNPDGVGDVLYAPDVTVVTDANGKKTYYLYPNVQHDKRNSLVAKSDRPDGPFVPVNWSKEVADSTVGPFAFDPACFVDDDGRVYGYWGFERSYAAELDPMTMSTVKPGTKIIRLLLSVR